MQGVEVWRAINGNELAASEIELLACDGIPIGLTPDDHHRLAFTTKEPVGVVVAISAFNHPLSRPTKSKRGLRLGPVRNFT